MPSLRHGLLLLGLGLFFALTPPPPAAAEVRIWIGLPQVSIRLNVPMYPELIVVPGLPVYYAPNLEANYFYYDGYYWVYLDDNWYASDWFNGPWWLVEPDQVPLFILRIPIRYYRLPPLYFFDWPDRLPPRWGHRWGHDWERRHHDWDRWERRDTPQAAPLPDYQRDYTGNRYPGREQRQKLHREHDLSRPQEEMRHGFEPRRERDHTSPRERWGEPPRRRDDLRDEGRGAAPTREERFAPHVQPQREERNPMLRGQPRQPERSGRDNPSGRPLRYDHRPQERGGDSERFERGWQEQGQERQRERPDGR